jgi:hypothetical protein
MQYYADRKHARGKRGMADVRARSKYWRGGKATKMSSDAGI